MCTSSPRRSSTECQAELQNHRRYFFGSSPAGKCAGALERLATSTALIGNQANGVERLEAGNHRAWFQDRESAGFHALAVSNDDRIDRYFPDRAGAVRREITDI